MPRRQYTYQAHMGWSGLNLVETLGSYLLAAGLLLIVANLAWSRFRGAPASNDPFGGDTLEWSVSSPPPVYNFAKLPQVHSRMPLWEGDPTKEGGIPHGKVEEETEQVTIGGAALAEMRDPDDENKMSAHDLGIHLPPPSFWPLVLAMGVTAIFVGLIFRQVSGTFHNLWYLMFAGVATTILSIYAWAFEPGH
jgi:hypothetical protein